MLKEKFISFKLSTTPLRNAFHSLRYREVKLWPSFTFPSIFPPSREENRLDRSFVVYQHHARRILDGIHGHAGCERLSKVPLHSSRFFLSFFLAVFFLTFWNRHGAERGSLTKVGNHTHRFHAIPVRSTRLQGGRVRRASSARVFLPTMQPRKDSRRSSF